MATLGFPVFISIILCLTVKIRGDFTIITAVSKLKDMVDKLKDSVDSINVRIDNLEKLSNTNNVDSTKKDNVMTETGDVEQTNKRVIKALISEKGFVRKSLSVYEGKFKDFQKQMTEQMNVINSKLEASHDTCERICADNVANLNSWNKSQENNMNRLEYAINIATIDHETRFIALQQTIDQVATNASTKIESVEMDIYESLPTRTEKIWASIGICPIPFDIDRRLSVKYELSSSSHVDVREGDTIRNQDYAIFNCSNVIEQKYEPSSRRFQCVRGQWMEADISHDWKLGNNGAFPECREAICDHPCENGGVCFQDGLCRCEHMTTGERCQTLVCHENCTKNGGECVKPGTCGNCPKSRHGENCETANGYEFKDDFYLNTPSIEDSCENGDFEYVSKCVAKTDFKYVVRIQVSDRWIAGTRHNVDVRIYGHDEHTATFRMNGLFGRNKLVETEFRGIDVRPIQAVVVSKDRGMNDDHLSILHVSIFIAESDDYYVFTKDDQPVWLTASTPVELSISRHPERCIHTYGEAMNRSPKHRIRGTSMGFIPLRECKHRCVTTRSLSCKSIHFMPSAINSRGFGHCLYFTHSPDSNYFRDNIEDETRRQLVSFKRICREP